MKSTVILGVTAAAGAIVLAGQFSGAATDAALKIDNPTLAVDQDYEILPQGASPDVIVWDIFGFQNYSQGNMRAYAIGTESCNIGDVPLAWFANTNQHPVIGQNMFRLAPGQNGHPRFEQLGQSWLKHGFCALDLSECGTCQGTGCNTLGVGCSDPYSASLNGSQSNAGPKFQVNATTGFFPYPPADPSYSGAVARRLQVPNIDVESVTNPDARYFMEGQYVCPDENASIDIIRSSNNASWREAILNDNGSMAGYADVTQRQQPGIYAWKSVDPGVTIAWRAVTNEGNYYVASQAYDNGDGTWDYEYAVQNLDSDRSGGSIVFDIDESVTVSDFGFKSIAYHSGEPFTNEDWISSRNGSELRWDIPQDFASNPNGNAIRWGNLTNFRFTADSGPVEGEVFVGFFKPGDTGEGFVANAKVPVSLDLCTGDFNEDGIVGFADLTQLLSEWGFCFNCPEDFNGDFNVAFEDLVTLLSLWGPCP